jgi:hypothetical protein
MTTIISSSKVNWLDVKHYYLENAELSLRDISKIYGIPIKTVEVHCNKEGWVNLRQSIGVSTTNKVVSNAVDERSNLCNEHAEKYELTENITYNLMLRINKRLARIIEADPEGENDNLRLPISPQQWNYLVQALKTASDGRRMALGLTCSYISISASY